MSLSYKHIDTRSPLGVQRDVIGALLIRELHTRFGRNNIGYLWVFAEPMMLASVITMFHIASGGHMQANVPVASFWVIGYTPYAMLRSIIGRAEAAVESNRALLYHRMVTVWDILIARAALEFCACVPAIMILLGIFTVLGYGNMPDRPLLFIAGMLLLLFLCFGFSLVVSAACEVYPVIGRLVHPAIYFLLPICGSFIATGWATGSFREFLVWVPFTTCFELIRMGQFETFDNEYCYPLYVIGWSLVLTILGMVALRIARRHMHME